MGRVSRGRLVAALAAAIIAFARAAPALADCIEPEPDAYRTSHYRAPTPCTLRGGTVVDTEAVARLQARHGALLVDVMPAARLPANFPADSLWLPKSRWDIPGSVWLANAGYGVLPIEEEAHFRYHLKRLTRDDKDRLLVFYCLADCWMSWNAARRAIEWGYRAVHWYPDGTDGWEAAGLALEESYPLPLEDGDKSAR